MRHPIRKLLIKLAMWRVLAPTRWASWYTMRFSLRAAPLANPGYTPDRERVGAKPGEFPQPGGGMAPFKRDTRWPGHDDDRDG